MTNDKDFLTIDIFWDDLIGETQEKLIARLGANGDYDVFPIATITKVGGMYVS